ncbi:MAG: hypothetical protein ACRDPE_11250 [Solirubrobacterales bacterium]
MLVAIGLSLEIFATLFISLDAFSSQRQTVKIYEVLDWLTGLEVIGLRTKPATETADNLSAEADARLRAVGVPEGEETLVSARQELEQMHAITLSAEKEAELRNKEIFQDKLAKVSEDFSSRKNLIAAAIALVVVGGVCELVGGLVEACVPLIPA